MKNHQKIAAAMVACGLLLLQAPRPAVAGGTIIGATEPTQLLNNIQLVQSYYQQLTAYQKQLEQYAQQMKDGTALSNQAFGNVSQDLVGVQHVVQGGNSLSYAMGNLDSQFTAKFGGLGYTPTTPYAQQYATWSKTSMDSTRTALDAAGLQNQQMNSEAQLMQTLQQHSTSATGQMQAIQAGNEIAAAQVQQLMELRQLMMADMQSKASFQAMQISQQDEALRANQFFQGTHKYDNTH